MQGKTQSACVVEQPRAFARGFIVDSKSPRVAPSNVGSCITRLKRSGFGAPCLFIEKTKIGIVIPLYDDPNLVNCVSVLMREINSLADCDVKIVIVDSSPHPIDYDQYGVFKDPRITVLQYPGTIGEARDRGVKALPDRDVILNLDSDCIPMQNWISSYLELLKKYDVAYGVYHTKGHWISNLLISLGTAPLGGNMAYKRIVWEKVGGFQLPRYEDTMFLKKARKAGFTFVFEPKIAVNHLRPHGLWRTIKDDLLKGALVWMFSEK